MPRPQIFLEGIDDVIRRMNRLDRGMAPRVLRPILLKYGARPIWFRTKMLAPVRKGHLSRSLVAKESTVSVSAYVSVDMSKIPRRDKRTGKKVRYPFIVEYGRRTKRGKKVGRRPYFWPAYRQTRGKVLRDLETQTKLLADRYLAR